MRRRSLCFLAALACAAGLLQPSAAAGNILTAILKGLSRSEEAVEVGRAAATAGKIGRIENNLGKALTSAETKSIENAYERVKLATLVDDVRVPMQSFDRLMEATPVERAKWEGSIALADDLPNVRVRFPQSVTGADEALRLFTQTRLKEVLEAPFDVADVRVAVAGLADDPAASASELAAFRRTIPAANFDDVGYLARLDGADISHQEMIARLRPYEGKTVIVVGHVPEHTSDFFIRLPNGRTRQLQISKWIDAAEEAGVNLIPIGCNSEKLGPIGARGLLNSRNIRQALRAMIESSPKTGKEFLRALTSDGKLELMIDPFEAKLVSNGIKIRDRRTKELVANLGLNGLRGTRAAYRMTEQDLAVIQRENLGTCLGEASPAAFDTCVTGKLAAEKSALDRYLSDCRKKNRKLQPALYQKATEAAFIARMVHLEWLAGFVISALLLAWMASVSSAARSDEQDKGTSLRHVFNRWRARQFVHTVFLIGPADEADIWVRRIVVYLLVALAGSFLAFEHWAPSKTAILILIGLFGLTGLMLVGTVIEYGKKALVQGSLVDLLVAISAGGLMLTGYLEFEARDRVQRTSAHANDMLAENFVNTYASSGSGFCVPLDEGFEGSLPLPVPISPP